jgi:hypothetical protein
MCVNMVFTANLHTLRHAVFVSQYSSWLGETQLAMREPWAHGHNLLLHLTSAAAAAAAAAALLSPA